MIVFDNFREILGLMVLITGFSIALLVLPDVMQKPSVIYTPNIFPSAQQGTQVEKINVPIHTLFATQ